MACRNCSTAGQLPRRLAGPLQQSFLDSAQVPLSLIRAGATAPSVSRLKTTPTQSTRRALHISAPRQKLELKKLFLGRVAERLASGKSTYYVYSATERMYKACASPSDYIIDPKDRKAGKLKTSGDGEEIGTSKGGPWHNGLSLPASYPLSTGDNNS